MTSRLSPIALLLLGSVGSIVACASGDHQLTQPQPLVSDNHDWQCERADVPMGEVLRCKSGGDTKSAQPSSTAVGGDLGVRSFAPAQPKPGCDAGAVPTPEPPPVVEEPPTPAPPAPPPKEYECTPGSSPDCPAPDVEVPASPPPAPGNDSPGPDECAQVSSLSYCGSPPPPPAPPPPGGTWSCSEDTSTGEKTCDGPPSCARGSHASKCGACVLDGESDDCAPPSEGGCWVTGGGFVTTDGRDNFGGNAKQMKGGGVQGEWTDEGHANKSNVKGTPSYIFCRHVDGPGPGQPGGNKGFDMNQIYFGGPAQWRGGEYFGHGEWRADKDFASGYWFDVVAKDLGEPGVGSDTYHLTVRKMVDTDKMISGAVVYDVAGTLAGGNIQIHPPNNGHPGFQSTLPAWVSLEP